MSSTRDTYRLVYQRKWKDNIMICRQPQSNPKKRTNCVLKWDKGASPLTQCSFLFSISRYLFERWCPQNDVHFVFGLDKVHRMWTKLHEIEKGSIRDACFQSKTRNIDVTKGTQTNTKSYEVMLLHIIFLVDFNGENGPEGTDFNQSLPWIMTPAWVWKAFFKDYILVNFGCYL